uniref:Caspase family p20 domain-containing protein n=1 Tax=Panagrolaimus sp. JU765 TaxID=591449 RepID=A0AC34PXH7_9BILA
MSNGVSLSTNLNDLPYVLLSNLGLCFENNNLWQLLGTNSDDPIFCLSQDEIERTKREKEPGMHYLEKLGLRGQTVGTLLKRLHVLAKTYGPIMDRPQLLLHRKFCPVIWSRPEQIKVSIVADGTQLKLECKASGFPVPRYEWRENGKLMDCGNVSYLLILRCPCTARNVFNCRVYNFIEDDQPFTEFYKSNGKTWQSELVSNVVDLSNFVSDPNPNCEQCNRNSVNRMYNQLVNGVAATDLAPINEADSATLATMTEAVVAADKVALIISNKTYLPYMMNLITPHCDAETLAELLQQLKFKTVTLSDLKLDEMKTVIKEYRKLLGTGVYAVFYFVGHGFEANGQCYLLPTDAPGDSYGPEHCVSMDWVLEVFNEFNPALNLIVLDMCRKFLPANLEAFIKYSEKYRQSVKINRNMVYGYATSGGVGAYEVKGETNGVFMKYFKNRLSMQAPIIEVLNRVFRDIEKDKKVRDVQIPELRSNLTKPRSLHDPLIFDGHTESYDHHTMFWRLLHELPNPTQVVFLEQKVVVMVWFDFCGHFTNKVYVFSSVGDLKEDEDDESPPSEHARSFLAYLKFDEAVETAKPKVYSDEEEGESICILMSNLQRLKGEVQCTIELRSKNDIEKTVAKTERNLGHVLITRLFSK